MHELLEVLAATPKAVAHLIVEVPEAGLGEALGGGWTPRQVIAHLRDTEYLHYRLCLERMLIEEAPRLRDFDTEAWEQGRNVLRDEKGLLLADFALQRQASLSILRSLRPADWTRIGRSDAGHELTVLGHTTTWVAHDREHLAQLEEGLGETLNEVLARRARLNQ